MTATMHSSIGDSPGIVHSATRGNNGGLFNRIRTSFSGSHRPTFTSPHLSSSEGESTFDGGKGMQGIGMDVRLRKRKSIFRRNGRNVNDSSITTLPPQLILPLDADLELSMEKDEEMHSDANTSKLAEAPLHYTISTAGSPKQRLEAHHKARLDVRRACALLDQCAKEIKMRGLAMVGIFRPFRTSEDFEEVERLIELYLLSSEPYLYQGIFALDITLQSSLLKDALGKPDPEVEFRKRLAYANIHNVVALFKWGLRRLQLRLSDLRATEQYSWYETFAREEREQNYPLKAFSTILLPLLSNDTAKLFKIVLDLMSTVAAHHFSNAMPAWKICRILGYWLFGRIGVHHEASNFQEAYKAWEKSSKVAEHLLLALIREQSSQFHLMPSRLTELVADYPYFAPHQNTPSLPPVFSSKNGKALFVEIRTENVIINNKQVRKLPKEILQTSLKAENIDLAASEDVDDWTAIQSIVSSTIDENQMETEEANVISIKNEELLLFKEEDARVLELAAEELQKRKNIYEGRAWDMNKESGNVADSMPTYNSASSMFSRPSDSSLFSLSNDRKGSLSRSSSYAQAGGLGPLTESKDENFDWGTFSSSGFKSDSLQNKSFQLDKKFKPKTELEKVFEEQDRIEAIASEKKATSSNRRNGKKGTEKRGEPKHILAGVSSVEFDDTFASIWQDQLLDDCPAVRLPLLVCAQLNQRTSGALLGNAGAFSFDRKDHWLIINETTAAPKALLPPSPASTVLSRRSSIWRSNHRRGDSGEGSNESNGSTTLYEHSRQPSHNSHGDDDDRQSLFSIRSGFSTHFKRPANGLRRMKSMLSTRKDSSLSGDKTLSSQSEIWSNGVESAGLGITGKKESDIDAEVRELKAAVYADREKRKLTETKQQKSKESEPISIISPSSPLTPTTSKKNGIKRKPAPLHFAESQDTAMTNLSSNFVSEEESTGLSPPTPVARNGVQIQMEGSYSYSAQSSPTSKYLDAHD